MCFTPSCKTSKPTGSKLESAHSLKDEYEELRLKGQLPGFKPDDHGAARIVFTRNVGSKNLRQVIGVETKKEGDPDGVLYLHAFTRPDAASKWELMDSQQRRSDGTVQTLPVKGER